MSSSLVRIGSICDLINGRAFKPSEWSTEGLPIVRIQNLNNPSSKFNHYSGVPLERFLIENGELLFAWSGTPGTSFGAHIWNGGRAVLNQHIFRVAFDRARVEKLYLLYALNHKVGELIGKAHGGVGLQHVTKGVVEDTRIFLPNPLEQRRIVDLLARAEGIVRLRREAAAKAAELIPALFIHHFGDPDNAEPQTLAKLGSVLSRPIRNGISPSKAGKYPGKVLTLSAITRGSFDATAVKDSEFANPIADTDMVSSLDMLVCRGNGNKALVGAACFAPRDMPGVAFPDTAIAVRPDQSVVLPPYLETLWATAFIRRQIDAIAKTTNGTYKINQTGLASIRFPVPSLERQQVFCEVLAQVKGIARQQLAAELKAQSTFDALLAQAFAPT